MNWDNIKYKTWGKTPPPWRPSTFDLVIYFLFLLKYRAAKGSSRKILILGATKELYFIARLIFKKITIVDYSANMLKITSLNKSAGEIITDKWGEFITNEKFDIVLGDLIFNVLSHFEVDRTLKNINRYLSDDYSILFRIRVTDCSKPKKKIPLTTDPYALLANLQTQSSYFSLTLKDILKKNTLANELVQKNIPYYDFPYWLYSNDDYLHFFGNYFKKVLYTRHPANYLDSYVFINLTKRVP